MRIGIRISPLASPLTGIPVYVQNLVEEIARIDRENSYFLYTNREIPFPLQLPDNFQVVLVRRPYPRLQLWYQIGLPLRIGKDRLDLYHDTLFLLPFFIGRLPGVITIHDLSGLLMPDFHQRKVSLTSKLIPLAVKKARRIIAVSRFTKEEVERLFPSARGKVRVVYNGVSSIFKPSPPEEVDRVREKYGIRGNYIMYLGTIEPRKNLKGLLRAFSTLRNKIPHWLVIVGMKGWKYEGVFQLLRELDIEKRVLFTGFVPTQDLPPLYSGADVFVYPSFYEGFGIPVLEAMACGTPVVVSSASSLPEVVGGAGLLADPRSPSDIAMKIMRIIEEPQLAEKLSSLGRKRAGKFTWERTARETLKVYREALESSSQAS